MAISARPVRLQLSRKAGFNLQMLSRATNGLPAIKVARPGPLGNPFVIGRDGDHDACVRLHRALCDGGIRPKQGAQREHLAAVAARAPDLRVHNVACWCRLDETCHGDTLLEIARKSVAR
jgi:hypothetical protein